MKSTSQGSKGDESQPALDVAISHGPFGKYPCPAQERPRGWTRLLGTDEDVEKSMLPDQIWAIWEI